MKYVMGLIVAFALGTTAYTQDTKDNKDCEDASSSTKVEGQQSTSPTIGEDKISEEIDVMYGDHVIYGAPEEGFSKMERMSNGSVYYYDYPNSTTEGRNGNVYNNENGDLSGRSSVPEDTSVEAESETEAETDKAEAEMGVETEELEIEAEGEVKADNEAPFSLGKACALNSILDSREGKFELKHEGDDEDLKMEREKDGDASIKYESENEYYIYEENKKGEHEYVYGIVKDDGLVEIVKNKDGSGDVFYQKHFDNLEDAELNTSLDFEGVESVCNQ